MVFGLTGKACAGKDVLLPVFLERGFIVLDADKMGHLALENNKDLLVKHFGPEALTSDGQVNRKALGQIVFKNKKALKILEGIVHPWVVSRIQKEVFDHRELNYVINAALLQPSGMDRLCNSIIWVQAPLITRIRRALKRDQYGFFKILERIWNQRHISIKALSQNVDILRVDNGGSIQSAQLSLTAYLEKRRQ